MLKRETIQILKDMDCFNQLYSIN